jgi:hypothetical protein
MPTTENDRQRRSDVRRTKAGLRDALPAVVVLVALLDAAGIGDPRQSLQITFVGGTLAWLAALGIKTRRAG